MNKKHKVVQPPVGLSGQCAICPIKGLFPEVCKRHREQMLNKNSYNLSFVQNRWFSWGTKLATGAGVGLAGSVAGLAIIPAFGTKAVLGHIIGYKIVGAATATGAGVNISKQMKKDAISLGKKKIKSRFSSRKKFTRLPYTLSS
jgi:hypothetical protein